MAPVVVLGFYKRKPGTTQEQFRHHWVNVHGPLIRDMPGIENFLVRYVQHHLDRDSPAMGVCEYDGFSEAWFVDAEAKNRLFTAEAFQAARKDEELFLDMEATRLIVQDDEQVIIPGGPEVHAALVKAATFK